MGKNATGSDEKKAAPRIPTLGGYNAELEQWLQNNAEFMGERSNFGGLVAAIEKGGNQGNSGTKGVGCVRIEPFEEWKKLKDLHHAMERAARTQLAFQELTTYERWLLCARYVPENRKVKQQFPGLHGQLGDLIVVAFVFAEHAGLLARLFLDAGRQRSVRWIEAATGVALEEAHGAFAEARARVDAEIAALEPKAVANA